jgi:acetoin utilization deacetylase AcuC-like enzyme
MKFIIQALFSMTLGRSVSSTLVYTGSTLNVAWSETGLTGSDYRAAFRWAIMPVLRTFSPELIVVSAGFDAALGDPLGGMALTPPAYDAMTTELLSLGAPMVVALEGGYNKDAISACSEAVLRAMLRGAGEPESASQAALREGALAKMRRAKCKPGTCWRLSCARTRRTGPR